jgi:hypothetical protein
MNLILLVSRVSGRVALIRTIAANPSFLATFSS